MTILEIKKQFITELSPLYPKEEILSFFYLLSHYQLKMSKTDIALNPHFEVKNQHNTFLNALEQLKEEIPIQYIIGETEFYDLKFIVTKNVLIPRPETEELVEWIINSVNINKKLKIIDIGTGSGCIAISLAKNIPNAEVFALDVSEKALKIAKQNAKINNVNIKFIKQNILETEYLKDSFDVIVSNPPYVRELEKQEIKSNVLNNEPHLALFVKDNNPLLFYNKIAGLAKKGLNKNGFLFFEINQYLGKETVELLQHKGFKNIVLRKDFFENDRMLKCEYLS